LLDLDRKHLCAGHLLVEKLDYPLQARRYLVRDEDQSELLGLEVGSHLSPKDIRLFDAKHPGEKRVCGAAPAPGVLFEPRSHTIDAEGAPGVGGVVEHLRDHLAADLVVGALLDLYKRRNTPRVEVEVVERQTTGLDPVPVDTSGRFFS
jgi:hypothetical protein